MANFQALARGAMGHAGRIYFHSRSVWEARTAIANRKHVAPLSSADRRRTVEYATEVLGSRVFAPWLQLYTSVRGGFRDGWIPDNFYGQIVIPKTKGEFKRLSSLRGLSSRILATPYLPDVAYVANHTLFDRDSRPLANLDRFRHGPLVFKADFSLRGTGTKIFAPGEPVNPEELPNGVFQPFVKQHDELAAFYGAAVATLRVTTVIEKDGRAGLRAAFIRFGRTGEQHVSSATHICASVDLESGEIPETAMLPTWLPTDRHPDSGVKFAGRKIPAFRECVKIALDLQSKVPFTPSVGWDFAVDGYGTPVLLEWNGGHNGIKLSEATAGPCFLGLNWESYR